MNRVRQRCDALRGLEALTALLINRFGDHVTLGELRAAVIAHHAIYTHKPLTLTELAVRSGQSKQSISRWVRRIPWLKLVQKPDDARCKLIDCEDRERLVAYLDEFGAGAGAAAGAGAGAGPGVVAGAGAGPEAVRDAGMGEAPGTGTAVPQRRGG